MAGAYVHNIDPFAIQISESFGLRWYGLAYLTGFLAGYALIHWLARRRAAEIKPEQIGDFIFSVAVGTIVGGRLGYCLFYAPELFTSFTHDPPFWGVLAVNQGGMASHGGILGIFLACIYFARKHELSSLHLADLTALCGTVGVFFGRIANFINGELVGRPCPETLPWAVKFPQDILLWPSYAPEKLQSLSDVVPEVGVSTDIWQTWLSQSPNRVSLTLQQIVHAIQSGNENLRSLLAPHLLSRHPSQLYEALLEGLFLFVLLLFAWKTPRKPGVVMSFFFVAYACVRIFGEQFRMPDAQIGYQLFGLTRGQWLSLAMLVLGIISLFLTSRRKVAPTGGWHRKTT